MLAFVLTLIFGIGIAFFATQNTRGVTVVLANSPVPGIPLYMVVLASLLLGVLVAWFISLFGSLGSFFERRETESHLVDSKKRIRDLETKIKDLEIENVRFREEHSHLKPSIKDRILARA